METIWSATHPLPAHGPGAFVEGDRVDTVVGAFR